MKTPQQLRDLADAMEASERGEPIQFYSTGSSKWINLDVSYHLRFDTNLDYRPAPKPVTRPWSKPEDVPGPVCWIRPNDIEPPQFCQVVAMTEFGFTTVRSSIEVWEWSDCQKYSLRYSTDRREWKPCEVTE